MKSESEVTQSCQLFRTPWTVAYQAPPSMGFSRQDCWSRLPFPSPGDLPNPGIKPGSPTLQADALPSEPPSRRMQMKITMRYHFTSVRMAIVKKTRNTQGRCFKLVEKKEPLGTIGSNVNWHSHSGKQYQGSFRS